VRPVISGNLPLLSLASSFLSRIDGTIHREALNPQKLASHPEIGWG